MKLILGADTQAAAVKTQINTAVKGKAFPRRMRFTNHLPRDICLPEIKGLFLKHSGDSNGASTVIEVQNLSDLQRVVSSVVQIAALNHAKKAMTIEDIDEPAKSQAKSTTNQPVEQPTKQGSAVTQLNKKTNK